MSCSSQSFSSSSGKLFNTLQYETLKKCGLKQKCPSLVPGRNLSEFVMLNQCNMVVFAVGLTEQGQPMWKHGKRKPCLCILEKKRVNSTSTESPPHPISLLSILDNARTSFPSPGQCHPQPPGTVFPTTLFVPSKVPLQTTCRVWKKMSQTADLALSWVHHPHVTVPCTETAPPIGGDKSSLLGPENRGQGRTREAEKKTEFTTGESETRARTTL